MRGMRETDSHALLCVLIYFLEPFLGKYNHYITVLKVRELWDLSRTQAGARDGICPSVRGRLTDREDRVDCLAFKSQASPFSHSEHEHAT